MKTWIRIENGFETGIVADFQGNMAYKNVKRMLQEKTHEEDKKTIGLAGDVMIGRTVDDIIGSEGYGYPWGNLLTLLGSTDINLINLETTLTNSNKKIHKVFNFKAAPDRVNTLTEGHITAVNLANNHILDFSEEGLIETIHTLEKARIKYVGAGRNEEEAGKPVILTCGNIRIGLVGLTDNEPGWHAGTSNSGTNYINVFDNWYKEKALKSIRDLRKEADLVILSIHWGPNMKEKPDPAFVEFAHGVIDNGADIIHGHSAHIFQGIEIYRQKLILYDTGDFVDDYAVDPVLRNDHSFFFLIEIDEEKLFRLQLIPVLISKYQVNLALGAEARWSIWRMQQLSTSFGTRVSDEGEVIIKKYIPANEN